MLILVLVLVLVSGLGLRVRVRVRVTYFGVEMGFWAMSNTSKVSFTLKTVKVKVEFDTLSNKRQSSVCVFQLQLPFTDSKGKSSPFKLSPKLSSLYSKHHASRIR